MARFIKAQKETIGLAPDALIFRGERKRDNTRLSMIDYNLDAINEFEAQSVQEVLPYDESKTTSWLNVDGLQDEAILKEISEGFHIDQIIISDILNTHTRPKIHEYDNCIYVSMKMLQFNELENEITSENLVLIIKENILISFQEQVGDVFNPVRERLRSNKKRFRGSGTDYLACALIDTVIDNYIYLISRLGEKIECLDEQLIQNYSKEVLKSINDYKSEIIYLRKIIKPCREMVINFVKTDSDLIHKNIKVYLKELQNNIELANESIDSYQEILYNQLNVYQTNVSNRLNDILKILTIFSVIFIPITFVVGVYGTNFDFIPELHWRYGYFMMWGVIVVIILTMLLIFKNKKWL